MIGIVILVLVIVLVFWFVSIYNKLVSLRMNVKEGFSTIDVFLNKR